MRSVMPIAAAKAINLLVAFCLCVFGLLVIFIPDMSGYSIWLATGIFMIAFGVVKLLGYFSKDLYRLAFQYDLQLGFIFLVLGIVILASASRAINYICIVFGISIFIDSIFKIKISVDAKKFGIKAWFIILIFAVTACIFGIILLFRPSDNERVWSVLFGCAFCVDGVLNLIEKLSTVKIIKHQKTDNIDREPANE